ncbi:hypothetical protein A9W99_14095 [Mycobacterium sp. 1164966.3]|uniref:hypothetical protein n=1 Tax=Mycobacterium sp. 1164966.3 TaxID=1856861 RepID=UPI0007FC8893|nr:hypothetical protein [Mycobacterium sp. 1164966.3]OBA81321.1 hypothetical protein A9W99_14095 [Mycobacterium sp. 1164966.3]
MNRPAAQTDEVDSQYFLRLLYQICRRTNLRIDMYQRGIAVATARGDVGYACAFRHLTQIEEQDRQILQDLIDTLQRRFPPSDEMIPPIPRKARPDSVVPQALPDAHGLGRADGTDDPK